MTNVSKARVEEMYALWSTETNDPESEEWREDLSEEEAFLVDSWDVIFDKCFETCAKAIVDYFRARHAKAT